MAALLVADGPACLFAYFCAYSPADGDHCLIPVLSPYEPYVLLLVLCTLAPLRIPAWVLIASSTLSRSADHFGMKKHASIPLPLGHAS